MVWLRVNWNPEDQKPKVLLSRNRVKMFRFYKVKCVWKVSSTSVNKIKIKFKNI